jgi:hypothetical protein
MNEDYYDPDDYWKEPAMSEDDFLEMDYYVEDDIRNVVELDFFDNKIDY